MKTQEETLVAILEELKEIRSYIQSVCWLGLILALSYGADRLWVWVKGVLGF